MFSGVAQNRITYCVEMFRCYLMAFVRQKTAVNTCNPLNPNVFGFYLSARVCVRPLFSLGSFCYFVSNTDMGLQLHLEMKSTSSDEKRDRVRKGVNMEAVPFIIVFSHGNRECQHKNAHINTQPVLV